MGTTLQSADDLRTTEHARALDLYAELQDQIATDDQDRILWICDQVAPTPSPALAPLFERVLQTGPPLARRAALHALATCAFYEGRGDDAERMWAKGLRAAADDRDGYWIRSCLNLAMAMQVRQCLFEPLVLTGMGRRAAEAAGIPYLVAYAGLSRAELLIQMGSVERAQAEIHLATSAAQRVDMRSQRAVLEFELAQVTATRHVASGDLRAALGARNHQLSLLRVQGDVEDAVWADTRIERLKLHFALDVEERDAILAEFDALPDELTLGPTWHAQWTREGAELRLQHAIDASDRDAAYAEARTLLDLIRKDPADSRKVLTAARLGRVLANELDDDAASKAAFEVASRACLNRIVEADRASREIPELAEATPDDWETLRDYRGHLAREQRELLLAVADNLKPGAAAFDLIVRDDVIRVCAWCSRVHTAGGAWQPLMHFVPDEPAPMLTHAICASCRARLFPGAGARV